jgi:hypothetical protein
MRDVLTAAGIVALPRDWPLEVTFQAAPAGTGTAAAIAVLLGKLTVRPGAGRHEGLRPGVNLMACLPVPSIRPATPHQPPDGWCGHIPTAAATPLVNPSLAGMAQPRGNRPADRPWPCSFP